MKGTTVRRGSVVEFYYDGSDPGKHRLGKVVGVRDLRKHPLQPETVLRSHVKRSRYLISCVMADKTYRQFYGDGLTGFRKVGMIRRAVLYLGGVRFETSDHKIDKMGKVRQCWTRLLDGRNVSRSV